MRYLKSELEIVQGNVNVFLGMEIKYNCKGSMFISQKHYIENIIKRFNMTDTNAVCVPADPHTTFTEFNKESKSVKENVPYKEAIGSLMFLTTISRPDIAFAVGVLSRYAENPTKAHSNGVKGVIKYLKGTLNYGLEYKQINDINKFKILVFSDADFAGDCDTRKSTSGLIVKLGNNLISWSSRKQKSFSLSTTESEFVVACGAVQEIVWLKRLINDLISDNLENPVLYIDNQSAIKIIKNPKFHCKTKHM